MLGDIPVMTQPAWDATLLLQEEGLPSPGRQQAVSLQTGQKSKHGVCADKQKLSVGCEHTFPKAKPSWSVLRKIHRGRGRTEIKGKISKNAACKVEALASAPAQAAKAELAPTLQISAGRELAIYSLPSLGHQGG